jgi:long-subunit fatty acid transport protein
MLRLALGAAMLITAAEAGAQRVPARDLLNFPLGLAGEPAAFGDGAARGLWNPATSLLRNGERASVALSALSAPIDVALSGQVVHGAFALRSIGTLSVGVARAAIQELVHTETDPQSIGGDIPYSTWVVSFGFARRVTSHLDAGASVRWRQGHVFNDQSGVMATDVGLAAHGFSSRDIRIAASTYLWSPGDDAGPTLSIASDGRIGGRDTLRQVRGGIALVTTRDGPTEQYPFIEARYEKVAVRGGPVHIEAYGNATWRLRMAVLLRHGGYTISIAREDNANGLAATYQLGVMSIVR